jgi:hypothetical protein
MSSRTSVFRPFVILLVVLMMSGTHWASPLSATIGTGFTYQGKLTDGNVPANGTYDFEFKLYNALGGGVQVGGTVTQGDVAVTSGLFTVQVDFGDVFGGAELYLEIGVRPGVSTGAYTALAPRQQLTATPYAIYAAKAPWSGLTGMPAGFADGVDDNTTYSAGTGLALAGFQFNLTTGYQLPQSCTGNQIPKWSGTAWACASDNSGSSHQNIKVVAKSGGDFTTITAALNSISDASASNHYLVYVAPGTYGEQVTMKPFVDIEGAGELATRISFTGNSTATNGTVLGANNAELRFVTVETIGAAWAVAIYNGSTAPHLTHITASASGGTNNIGVYNYSSASPTMTNVTASASGGTSAHGVYNASSSPMMTDVTATALGGSNNYGVYNNTSSPTMTDVTATASGGTTSYGVFNDSSLPTMTHVTATASASGTSCGVYNSSSSPTMTNVTASALNGWYRFGVINSFSSPTMTNVTTNIWGGLYSYGVYNDSSSPTIQNCVLRALSGTFNYGIYNTAVSGSYTVLVNHSQITGSDNTIRNDTGFTTRVGASQLSGGAVTGGGTVTCVGVYDENYASAGYAICP